MSVSALRRLDTLAKLTFFVSLVSFASRFRFPPDAAAGDIALAPFGVGGCKLGEGAALGVPACGVPAFDVACDMVRLIIGRTFTP